MPDREGLKLFRKQPSFNQRNAFVRVPDSVVREGISRPAKRYTPRVVREHPIERTRKAFVARTAASSRNALLLLGAAAAMLVIAPGLVFLVVSRKPLTLG